MGDEEQATLESQFVEFGRFLAPKERDGSTISLWRSDYWMRHCKLLEDRKLTMTDTGHLWNRSLKSELNFEEWHEFLIELCIIKRFDIEAIELTMTNCGMPGCSQVSIPQYRDYFDNFKQKSKPLF